MERGVQAPEREFYFCGRVRKGSTFLIKCCGLVDQWKDSPFTEDYNACPK